MSSGGPRYSTPFGRHMYLDIIHHYRRTPQDTSNLKTTRADPGSQTSNAQSRTAGSENQRDISTPKFLNDAATKLPNSHLEPLQGEETNKSINMTPEGRGVTRAPG
eukprot:jgi/Chrzof1/8021/UNPLg00908.t1